MTDRWNILLITADDLGGDTPSSFGGPPGVMPAVDGLAGEGMAFHRAHVATAVCQPSRSAILTGLWPHRNGAEGFEPIADGIPVLTDYLREVGYQAGILGKVDHLQPVDRFGWVTRISMRELGMGRDPQAYSSAATSFFATHADEPWFLMANAHDPHRPFDGSADETARFGEEDLARIPAPSQRYHPGEHPVPGFLPRLPGVEQEYAQYLSSSRRCDDVVKALLVALDHSGQADRTIVIFLSDNGIAVPFAKANCYLQSTRTPLVIRWPGRTTPGAADEEHFVSALDLFPTLCEAAGIPTPAGLDGRSLTGLIDGASEADRDLVFTVFHETSAKRRFEMRCVQDSDFGYIWNAWSDEGVEYEAENMEGMTWSAMSDAAAEDPKVAARVEFYVRREPEELYQLTTDPNSLVNLAGDPAFEAEATRLRATMAEWLESTGDFLAERYRRDLTD